MLKATILGARLRPNGDDAVEMILHKLPTWEAQEDLIKKLQADLEEAKKLNRELQDQIKSS